MSTRQFEPHEGTPFVSVQLLQVRTTWREQISLHWQEVPPQVILAVDIETQTARFEPSQKKEPGACSHEEQLMSRQGEE
jgi:hypothetical protein